MMQNLDFTPAWYVRKLEERTSERMQLSGLLIVVLLLVAWTYDATTRVEAAAADRNRLHIAYAAQDAVMDKLATLEAEQTRHADDAALIGMLRGGVPAAELIAELSHLMPATMSLRTFLFDGVVRTPPVADVAAEAPTPSTPPDTTVLALVGYAETGREVGNFITDLTASPLFTTVMLEYERSEMFNNRPVVAFRIVCQMPEFE